MIIDLGCGENIVQDADIGMDWRNVLINKKLVIGDLNSYLPFRANSADEIYLRHVIEHFTRSEALALLQCISRVLKPQGILHIETPNIYKIIEFVVKEGLHDLESCDIPAWGTAAKAIWSENVFMGGLHKYGYSSITLTRLLAEANFTIMEHNDYNSYALIVDAIRNTRALS